MERMSGRQLAGWGYGIFWCGLLIETIDCIVSALTASPLASPLFWIGQIVTTGCVIVAISMMMMIHKRPWDVTTDRLLPRRT